MLILHRLHLYNNTRTDWFDRDLLTEMMRKYEGRIISIETKESNSST